ncbi:MAG: hypothetical protein FWD12_11920, partial [Alphaproteobacteria bacterium]|nr:hypothetical protein [Alphaproteobacteria bacterium]
MTVAATDDVFPAHPNFDPQLCRLPALFDPLAQVDFLVAPSARPGRRWRSSRAAPAAFASLAAPGRLSRFSMLAGMPALFASVRHTSRKYCLVHGRPMRSHMTGGRMR